MTGAIFLEASELSIGEANGTVFVPIVRTGDLSGPATVEYGITSITATDGVDYIGGTGTVTMGIGQDRVLVPVQIINDDASEPTETLAFSIINVDSTSTLLFPRTARANIQDDESSVVDPPHPPLTSLYRVTEQPVITDLNQPMAFEFAPQDPSVVYIAEKGGRIRVFDLDTGSFLPDFIDLTAQVNDIQDRGLMDIAVHPNFPERPYIYASYVVDPPDAAGQMGNAGPDGAGNRFAHVVRFTADATTGFTTVVPGSEVILVGGAGQTLQHISGGGAVDSTDNFAQPESGFNAQTGEYVEDYIKVDSRSHATGSLAFGPDRALYIAIGDGTSFNTADPRTVSVQSISSLAGKILRVDPITGLGLPDNPFVQAGDSLDANHSKVYQLGLRNPFTMGFDRDGRLIITNTGWDSWEEIERGPPGANFGWPYYEGGDNGVLLRTPGYQDLPEAAQFYAAVASGATTITPAFRAFAHASDEPGFQNQAITGGDAVYTGSQYPAEFRNDFFFTDITDHQVFVVDVNDRRDLKFLYEATGVPVRFSQGPDGHVYYADLIAGAIGRLNIASTTLTGTNRSDTLSGTGEADTLSGLGGNDTLNGEGGNDQLLGGAGRDTLDGGDGDDSLSGGAGNDRVAGGLGNDTIHYTLGQRIDISDGGDGTDTLNILGTNRSETLDVIFNGVVITRMEGGAVTGVEFATADLLGGTDTLSYAGTTANLAVDLAAGTASGFAAIAGIENVTTGSGDDTLMGNGPTNVLRGGLGNDTYFAGSNDRLIETGSGIDSVVTDSANFTLARNIENLTYTGAGSFTGAGSASSNTITGGATGDTLRGGDGADLLIGGDGADILKGGAGTDILDGGAGDDVMTGGSGLDSFVFAAGFGQDTITGFDANAGRGQDTLNVAALGIDAGNFAGLVSILDVGNDSLVTIGTDTITFVGVNGVGTNAITIDDFRFV
jgi:glucose/arabinose dehydrogenase